MTTEANDTPDEYSINAAAIERVKKQLGLSPGLGMEQSLSKSKGAYQKRMG
jgi:hypothetical protein